MVNLMHACVEMVVVKRGSLSDEPLFSLHSIVFLCSSWWVFGA